MDLLKFEENIKKLTDKELIIEGIVQIDDYNSDAKKILNKEIEARNISQDTINDIKANNKKIMPGYKFLAILNIICPLFHIALICFVPVFIITWFIPGLLLSIAGIIRAAIGINELKNALNSLLTSIFFLIIYIIWLFILIFVMWPAWMGI